MGYLQEFMGNTQDFVFIFYGAMHSGKTSTAVEEINALERYSPWGKHIIAFRPTNDSRKTSESPGKGFDSLPLWKWLNVNNPYTLFDILYETFGIIRGELYSGRYAVAIDEVNFFHYDIVDVIRILANMEIKIILCGLDLDYRRYPFRAVEPLLAMTPQHCKVQFSSCCKGSLECTLPARYTQRYIVDGGKKSPSSFFEATVIPESSSNQHYRYGVVCGQHHVVTDMPTDAFSNRKHYTQIFSQLNRLYAEKNFSEYERVQKEAIADAKKRNVL